MPIDIASGHVTLEQEDGFLPGRIPLTWTRHYSTTLLQQEGVAGLGPGWTTRYHCKLRRFDGGYVFVSPRGAEELFPDREDGVTGDAVVRNLSAYLELFREAERYIVQSWDVDTGEVRRYCFLREVHGQEWLLGSIEDVSGQGLDLKWERTPGGVRLGAIVQRLERRELKLAYNRAGLVESLHLRSRDGEEHRIAVYEYDALGRLADVSDAAGFSDRFEYRSDGRLHREIVKDGGVFHYRYDRHGRCVLRAGLGHYSERRLLFLDGARMTEMTDSYGEVSVHHHLPSGQMTLEVDPMGGRRSTAYDEHGRIVAKTDATGAVTQFGYDEFGNRNLVIDGLGNSTHFTFNDRHQPLTMIDPAGLLWHRQYDENHRVVVSVDPLGHQWKCGYDLAGNLCELVNPRGHRRSFRFEDGIPRSVSDWMGHETSFRFDAFGRIVERRGLSGEITAFQYDILGRPTRVVLADGSSLMASYDHAGNLTRFVDASGQQTLWHFGSCARLMARTDSAGGTVRFNWGTERERLLSVVNESGEVCEFEHDASGRVVAQTGFDGGRRQFVYDPEGHLSGWTNPAGEAILLERNAEHQVIAQRLPDGRAARFAYDPVGRLVEAINEDIGIRFERDAVGRVVLEQQGEDWVKSSYDPTGLCVRTETSQGHVVDFDMDPNGNASALRASDQTLSFEHDAGGRELACNLPGGGRLEQQFDVLGRLVEQRLRTVATAAGSAQGGESLRRTFQYNVNGAISFVVDSAWGRMDFEYDPAERLIGVLRTRGDSERFAYDSRSNLVRQQREGAKSMDESLVYGPGNRLLRKGHTQYTCDGAGRRVESVTMSVAGVPDAVTRYEWDAIDRLRSVTLPDGRLWTYKYDAFCRRIEKSGPDKTTRFIWNGETLIHEVVTAHEDGERNVASWIFRQGTFVPLAKVEQGRCFFVVSDHLGTPRELVDATGRIAWSASSLAYGRVTGARSGQKTDCRLRFQGQYEDAETGLHYNWNRYYDPDTGGFISPDPIGLAGGLNAYSYGASPTQWVDPLGLTTEYPILAQLTHVNSYGDEMVAMSKPSTKESLLQTHTYVNPGHHDPSSPTGNYNQKKSVLPPNHVELFQRSQAVEMKGGKIVRWTREGTGKDAVYHRFDQHANNEYHWNGSTQGRTKSGKENNIAAHDVPGCVKK